MGIEELIDEKIKYWEKQDSKSSCYHKEVGRFIDIALSDMEQLKSSLPTQPHIEMGFDEMVNELENTSSKSINKDFETGYNGGIRRALEIVKEYKKEFKPTQQDKVVVPELPRHIIDYLKWCERNNKTLLEVIGGARCHDADYAFWTEEEIRKIAVAYATGDYTVEKEQLYIVKVGELAFVNWEDSMLAKMTTMDSPGWVNEANHFTTKVRANEIAKIIGGEAVPVMEDE